jgi:phage-related protein
MALTSNDIKARQAMERAFFWLELQTAFIALHALEQSRNDIKTKRKLIIAKTNLSKKLAEYANETLREIA